MKKVLTILALTCALLTSCADSKDFQKSDGSTFTAQPYGWANSENKKPNVEYQLDAAGIALAIVFSETIVVPVIITGWYLYEPINYTE